MSNKTDLAPNCNEIEIFHPPFPILPNTTFQVCPTRVKVSSRVYIYVLDGKGVSMCKYRVKVFENAYEISRVFSGE